MYERKSRLSPQKRARLIKHFIAGTTARAAAQLVGVNKKTAATFFTRLRKVIADEMEKASPFAGEIEFNENYFGGVRKGKRVGRVYTVILPNAQSTTLLSIMEPMILPHSIVYTDAFRSYDALDVSDFHHVRIDHYERFVERQNHINGIENFWNQAKRHLRRFKGIPRDRFFLFLKECEWRFNGGDHKMLLNQLKQYTNQRQET